jgi:hypothetical protein
VAPDSVLGEPGGAVVAKGGFEEDHRLLHERVVCAELLADRSICVRVVGVRVAAELRKKVGELLSN